MIGAAAISAVALMTFVEEWITGAVATQMTFVVNHHEWITGVAVPPMTFVEWKWAAAATVLTMFAASEWI